MCIRDSPEAPPFRTLSERYPLDALEEAFVEGITTGHPDMPEFVATPEQGEQLISVLDALLAPRRKVEFPPATGCGEPAAPALGSDGPPGDGGDGVGDSEAPLEDTRTAAQRRIDALRGAGSWAGFVRAHAAGLAAAVVLTAGLSGWIGHTAAQVHVRADRDTLLAGYVASLDARIQTGLDEESP